MKRRDFIKNSGLLIAVTPLVGFAATKTIKTESIEENGWTLVQPLPKSDGPKYLWKVEVVNLREKNNKTTLFKASDKWFPEYNGNQYRHGPYLTAQALYCDWRTQTYSWYDEDEGNNLSNGTLRWYSIDHQNPYCTTCPSSG